MMAKDRREYQEKMIASFTLSLVAFLSRIGSPLIRLLATYTEDVRFKPNFNSTNVIIKVTNYWSFQFYEIINYQNY